MNATTHRRRRKPRNKSGRPPVRKGGRTPRHLYDVRQYALLADAAGNLLILQLPKEYDASSANTWTLPGGKLEPSDVPGEGLLREITEETGLKATLTGLCTVARWTNRNSKKLAIFYKATVTGTKPALKLSGEHQRAIWISPSEAEEFPFHRPDMLTVIKENL
ncbi:MAG: NUDIX domain-containing protein [Proteobacteria bacterium]|nr:NUDIX domain-containing protein [Pseudomonadota bacterium]